MNDATSAGRTDAVRNRLRVLEAADEVFSAHGIEAPLSVVAARAGVGVGTIYRGFGDKEALLGALVERRWTRLGEIGDEVRAAVSGWDGLVLLLDLLAERQAGDVLFTQLLERVMDVQSRMRGLEILIPVVEEVWHRAHAEGSLRDGLEVTDLLVVVGMLGSTVAPGGPEGQWRRYLALVVDGLRAGAGGPLAPRALTMAEVTEATHRRIAESAAVRPSS